MPIVNSFFGGLAFYVLIFMQKALCYFIIYKFLNVTRIRRFYML